MKEKFCFIGGIPAVGKSTLAKDISSITGCDVVNFDKLRLEMEKDQNLRPWVNYFADQDETAYWEKTNCDEHWQNLVKQSEMFWPTFQKVIEEKINHNKPVIFEGVNILPHLAKQSFSFQGIYFIGDSFKTIFERNKKDPRWGNTEELQKKEAEIFFYCEGPKFKKEAEKYGYKVFTDYNEAKNELIKIFTS